MSENNGSSDKRSLINVNIDHKFLWGILILLVVGLSYASTTISDSYINTTGQVNATEFYVNDGLGNSSKLTKSYDVVVCRTADTGCDVVCDSTNCGTKILNSINNANTHTVLIKSGIYNITSQITLKSNLEISGEGWNSTILRVNTAHLYPFYGANINNIKLNKMKIDGQNTSWQLILLDNYTDARIEDNYLMNVTSWIASFGSVNDNGLIPSSNLYFRRNIVDYRDGSGSEMIIVSGTSRAIFEQNTFKNYVGGAGLIIFGYANYVDVLNNIFSNVQVGILIQNAKNVKIISNDFNQTNKTGTVYPKSVLLRDADTVLISKNNFNGVNEAGTGSIGIYLSDFSGSTFDGHPNYVDKSNETIITENLFDNFLNSIDMGITGEQEARQSGLVISNNKFGYSLRNHIILKGDNGTDPFKNILIIGNYFGNNNAFDGGVVNLIGDSTQTNGGLQNITISNNVFERSSSGASVVASIDAYNNVSGINIFDNIVPNGIEVRTAPEQPSVYPATNVFIKGNIGTCNINQTTSHYCDTFDYTVPINTTNVPCTTNTGGWMAHNTTALCTCISGAWKCAALS